MFFHSYLTIHMVAKSEKHSIIIERESFSPIFVPTILKRGHKELSQNETPLYTALLQHAKKIPFNSIFQVIKKEKEWTPISVNSLEKMHYP